MACNIGDDVPLRIYGDKARCSEIVTNLVGNAIKYTEKGRVEVDMQLHDQTREHHVIRIEVRDTGIGIDEEKQARDIQGILPGGHRTQYHRCGRA